MRTFSVILQFVLGITDPESLAREYIAAGIKNGETFKAELYYQVMKQLVRNPSRSSLLKGWEMMILLLSNFAPPKDMENVVGQFLRKHVRIICCKRVVYFIANCVYNFSHPQKLL